MKQTKNNFGSNQNKPKRDLFRLCFGLFHETKNKRFWFVLVFRTYIETTEANRNVSKQTKTNRNNPKFSKKFQNMLFIKLFRLVFCLFRFNRNIESLCFGIEPKQPKQTVSKQTKTNRNIPKFSEKRPKYALYNIVVALLFVSVQSKH